MKKLTFILIAACAVISGGNLFAQGKYGADSAECIKYLNYYQEYYKQKNYDAALPNWRKAYSICPASASQNMFIHGTTLLTRVFSKTKDQAVADSILVLQDQRLAQYPKNKASILNNKGSYIVNFKGNDSKFVYDNLNAIISELGGETRASILVNNLQAAIKLFQENNLPADDVIGAYNKAVACIDAATPKNAEEEEQNAKVRNDLEAIFAQSKVASCENILNIFGPRFDSDPENVGLATTIVKLMNTAEDCLNNELYLKAVTLMHKNEPSASTAYYLYRLLSANGNTPEAIKYLEEAIAYPGVERADKAQYTYELANYCLKNGMKAKAYASAKDAVELGSGYAGKAYYLMGTIWGSTACGGNEIERRAPYWVAVDFLQKAKAADETLTEDANRLIGQYSAYYPPAADAFMYDLTAGQSYTVSCGGMSATTTVRTRN